MASSASPALPVPPVSARPSATEAESRGAQPPKGRLPWFPRLLYTLSMKVTLLLGSTSDTEFAQKIADTLKEFAIPSEIVVASAHKVPEKVIELVQKLNADPQPQVIITVVGMSNGLGGVVAGSSVHPVITCPPAQSLEEYQVDLHSSLRMPSDVPVMTVLHPKNAALAAVRILAEGDPALKKKVAERIEKIKAGY